MSTRHYLPGFDQGTVTVPYSIPVTTGVGRLNPSLSWDSSAGAVTSRTFVADTAPWTAMVALREWAVERAMTIADASDLAIPADVFAWELAETIANVVLGDVTAIDDAWSIGPWWERRHDVVMATRWETTAPLFPAAPKVIAATEKHAARKDGTIRTHRQRRNISIGGEARFTATGAPVSAEMAAIAALLPETGATADDAYRASIALQAQGLIPPMLGGEDWATQEMTPELRGNVRIESQRENGAGGRITPLSGRTRALLHEDSCPLKMERSAARKGKRPVDRSILCACDPTYRLTERVGTTERVDKSRRSTMVRGIPVLMSDYDNGAQLPWARAHIGDAIVMLAPLYDVERTVETRRLMAKGRKVTRYIGGKAKPNAPKNAIVIREGSTAKRTARYEDRASILAAIAGLETDGATTTWRDYVLTMETVGRRGHAHTVRVDDHDGATIAVGAPRKVATALAGR